MNIENPQLLILIASWATVTAYSFKKVVAHLEARGRLLILEHTSINGSISRGKAKELLREDLVWYRVFMNNVHIDLLDELEASDRLRLENGFYILGFKEFKLAIK